MTCGDVVETLEERVMYKSLRKISEARTRLEKGLKHQYKSQANVAYKKALTQNEVLLKEQASKFEKRIDIRDSWEQFETEDERDEYLRIKSHEWVQEQSVIFVENVIKDMQVLTNQYRTQGGQLPCNVSRANKYMV